MSIRPYRGIEPEIADGVWIDPSATVIGSVRIGEDASLWTGVIARGDGIPCIVGEECSVGHGVILHACTVGRRCLVGMGAILMDGALLGDEVIVGAGALVTPGTKLPSRTLWVGSPARPRRALDAKEIAFLAESAAHYVELKDEYLNRK
jgi:carbonic anhydrase/acetyltransferase-like protein (isoleucine patch superfamily)